MLFALLIVGSSNALPHARADALGELRADAAQVAARAWGSKRCRDVDIEKSNRATQIGYECLRNKSNTDIQSN